jgi:hypothetical protein
VTSYIYEPNLSFLLRYEKFPATAAKTRSIYDSGLIFMTNFDNIPEIGETENRIKDLSINTYR